MNDEKKKNQMYCTSRYYRLYNVVSSNPTQARLQHIYVIKFISDLRQVGGFSLDTPVSSINNTDRHDITEILLKVALNTINQPD
jgi:hypothetical protein